MSCSQLLSSNLLTYLFVINFNELISDIDGDNLNISTVPPSYGEELQTVLGSTFYPIGENVYHYFPGDILFDIIKE